MKKTMKKIVSTLMAAALAASALTACGGKGNTAGTSGKETGDKKVLKVAMECSYAPYNWTQPTDEGGAVPISGSSDFAYGYDVMMAKKIADELGYGLEIVKLDWDSLVPAVQSGKADFGAAGMTVNEERLESVDFTDTYANASQVIIVKK